MAKIIEDGIDVSGDNGLQIYPRPIDPGMPSIDVAVPPQTEPSLLDRLDNWNETALNTSTTIGPQGQIIIQDGPLSAAPLPINTVPGLGLEAARNMILGEKPLSPSLDAGGNEEGAAGAPGATGLPIPGQNPAMIDKKIGSTAESTTEKTATAAYKKAFADAQAGADAEAASVKEEQQAVENLAKSQGEFDAATAKVDQITYEAQAAATAEATQDIKEYMATTDARVAELANMKPETFWGSKSTSDKILASISIGLGSMGQAMLGSGENVGMTLLKRNMDEFDANQKRKFEIAMKDIDNRRLNTQVKMQMMDRIAQEYTSQRLAARAKVSAEMSKGLAMSKTAVTKASLGQKIGQIQQDAAKIRMDAESQYATQRTSTIQNDIIKKVQQMPGMTRSGEPMNTEQGKSLRFYNQMRKAMENIQNIDDTSPQVREALRKYNRDLQALAAASSVPVAGGAVGYATLKGYDTAVDRLKAASPEAYSYINNMNVFLQNKLRSESGASIGVDEYLKELNAYAPTMNDSNKDILNKRALRNQAALDMYTSTGL